MTKSTDIYGSLGVSATKKEVHEAIKSLDQGLYPGAFCKILPDVVAGSDDFVYALHADTAGTKSVLAYLYWKETGDASVFRGIAQDALVMNIDDLACVGSTTNFVISNTISRNAHRIPGEIVSEIVTGYEQMADEMGKFGIALHNAGGETADEGDLVSTAIAGCTVSVRWPKAQVIDASRIKPGNCIVALSSSGKCLWETVENSGIGSNGLTAARHVMLKNDYANQYPEAFSSTLKANDVFMGPYALQDSLEASSLNVGQALLSPTRTYVPFVHRLLQALDFQKIYGLIHNSGGGLTKCLRFGQKVHFVKNNPFELPPLFKSIKKTGNMSVREMNQVFNCGQRLEVYVDEGDVESVVKLADECQIESRVIGEVKPSDTNANQVTVLRESESETYSL